MRGDLHPNANRVNRVRTACNTKVHTVSIQSIVTCWAPHHCRQQEGGAGHRSGPTRSAAHPAHVISLLQQTVDFSDKYGIVTALSFFCWPTSSMCSLTQSYMPSTQSRHMLDFSGTNVPVCSRTV
jgi:hypothetical protein